jgi:hypothetical protein
MSSSSSSKSTATQDLLMALLLKAVIIIIIIAMAVVESDLYLAPIAMAAARSSVQKILHTATTTKLSAVLTAMKMV